MNNFKMWWILKGEEKVKKIVGKICRWFLFISIGYVILGCITLFIIEHGWTAVYGLGGVALFVFVVFAAVDWGDK